MISISYLEDVYFSKVRERRELHQAKITGWEDYADFATFAEDFLRRATFPRPQANKFETYGWAPTLFEPGFRRARAGREPEWGHWREGDLAASTVSLIVLDLDNANEAEPMVSLDDADAVLTGLNRLLYTSFSSTPAKPKFRIILQPTRLLTYAEAYDAYRHFDGLLHGQLDGSIYSPGDYLYGPPHGGEVRLETRGRAVDPAGIATGLPPMISPGAAPRRTHSPAFAARVSSLVMDHSTRDLSLDDVARPEWLSDLQTRSAGGSHSQTLMSVLSRIWLKAKGELTYGEMRRLFSDLDLRYGGYVERKYGRHEADRMVESIMRTVIPAPTIDPKEAYKALRKTRKWN